MELARRLLRRKQVSLTKDQVLACRPVRNPNLEWETSGNGEVVITLRRRSDTLGRVMSLLFAVPRIRRLVLEPPGTEVWALCDGHHSVEEIMEHLSKEYKLNLKEAELSLVTYLRDMAKRGLIGFAMDSGAASSEP